MTLLHGRRLVVCTETEDGCRLAESQVKEITGGDTISARRMTEGPQKGSVGAMSGHVRTASSVRFTLENYGILSQGTAVLPRRPKWS
jgi:hypothetical protein